MPYTRTPTEDREFYSRRAAQERRCAVQAASPAIAELHEQMAHNYQSRAMLAHWGNGRPRPE